MPILTVTDLPAAVAEHQAVLGLDVVMDHGWIVTLADQEGRQLSLMTRDATAPVNPDVSVFLDSRDSVEKALAEAVIAGCEVVHPLSEEPWGVTRFFYRDSSGRVINVGTHTR
ncbi:VOC family protein [Nocardioides daejeonensis]|uniref:VOC family protein n=1 Tax=Nocardioides daejeonensis TaxID=1046556 RepID=UPI001EF54FE4|nr:VOC family protein [Nocardioides daejeonensis]